MRGKKYEYLEKIDIETEYGVNGMVKERRDTYAETHSRRLIIGVMLCIISAVPLLGAEAVHYSNNTDLFPILCVALLLIMCAVGVKLIVLTCSRQGGYDRLLEEGDYSRLYLGWSFATSRWELTWMVWPVAGVLFAAYREIMKAIVRSR